MFPYNNNGEFAPAGFLRHPRRVITYTAFHCVLMEKVYWISIYLKNRIFSATLDLFSIRIITVHCCHLSTADSTHQELNLTADASKNRLSIVAKFAEFQMKVCNKLLKIGVDNTLFYLFVAHQFSPGECIPRPPSSFTEIFKAITDHGLWDFMHYFPLVRIVKAFGASDAEMEGWVQSYQSDLKAYCLATTVKDFVEADIDTAPANCAKYNSHYYHRLEWKSNFTNHSLQYLTEVWVLFSKKYLAPHSPPTALLDCVHKSCFSVTWLIPSELSSILMERIKIDTNFFRQHHILSVTVGEECVYEETIDESTLVSLL